MEVFWLAQASILTRLPSDFFCCKDEILNRQEKNYWIFTIFFDVAPAQPNRWKIHRGFSKFHSGTLWRKSVKSWSRAKCFETLSEQT